MLLVDGEDNVDLSVIQVLLLKAAPIETLTYEVLGQLIFNKELQGALEGHVIESFLALLILL